MEYKVENHRVTIDLSYSYKYVLYTTEFKTLAFFAGNPICFIPYTSLNDKPAVSYTWSDAQLVLEFGFDLDYVFVEDVGIAGPTTHEISMSWQYITEFTVNTENSIYACRKVGCEPTSGGMKIWGDIRLQDGENTAGINELKYVNSKVLLYDTILAYNVMGYWGFKMPYALRGVVVN